MKDADLFTDLDPPPHGLADLRSRVGARRRWWALPVGGVVAVAVALLLFSLSRPSPMERELLAALETPEQSVWVNDSTTGYLEVVVETASVVLVRWRPEG